MWCFVAPSMVGSCGAISALGECTLIGSLRLKASDCLTTSTLLVAPEHRDRHRPHERVVWGCSLGYGWRSGSMRTAEAPHPLHISWGADLMQTFCLRTYRSWVSIQVLSSSCGIMRCGRAHGKDCIDARMTPARNMTTLFDGGLFCTRRLLMFSIFWRVRQGRLQCEASYSLWFRWASSVEIVHLHSTTLDNHTKI